MFSGRLGDDDLKHQRHVARTVSPPPPPKQASPTPHATVGPTSRPVRLLDVCFGDAATIPTRVAAPPGGGGKGPDPCVQHRQLQKGLPEKEQDMDDD